jgi:hypothetical protein
MGNLTVVGLRWKNVRKIEMVGVQQERFLRVCCYVNSAFCGGAFPLKKGRVAVVGEIMLFLGIALSLICLNEGLLLKGQCHEIFCFWFFS